MQGKEQKKKKEEGRETKKGEGRGKRDQPAKCGLGEDRARRRRRGGDGRERQMRKGRDGRARQRRGSYSKARQEKEKRRQGEVSEKGEAGWRQNKSGMAEQDKTEK